jgi:hypothetical protein
VVPVAVPVALEGISRAVPVVSVSVAVPVAVALVVPEAAVPRAVRSDVAT